MSSNLQKQAETYLHKLSLDIPNRQTGREGNRMATAFFAETVAAFGFDTDCPEFDCIDWTHGDVNLTADGASFEAFVSPFTLGCQVSAPLIDAATVEQLESIDAHGKILLLHGELTKEQLMPKNFTFYNPDEHKHIIDLLETKQPAAIIAATTRNPELAGGMYPFPLIEDGDFDIPSVYMTDEAGNRLAAHIGQTVSLAFEANRIPAKGCNVIAHKGAESARRVVLCAHIDAKDNSPGALDNGTGVVVLLLLAELLADYVGELGIELVAFNGEDYYSAPGQMLYLESNADRLSDIRLVINLDLAGYREGSTAYSTYGCPGEIDDLIKQVFATQPDMGEGEPWYQSDHSIFIQRQVPAVAITSDRFMELSTYVTHTPKDRPELVDHDKLVNIAIALRDLLLELSEL